MTEHDIKYTISLLSQCTDEQLVHKYKCCSSKKTASEKKLVASLMIAIEKERKKRGSIKETKTVEAKEPKVGSASDMYED